MGNGRYFLTDRQTDRQSISLSFFNYPVHIECTRHSTAIFE